MNCRSAKRQLLERHDGEMSHEREAELQAHLVACGSCERMARETDVAFEWLRSLPDAQPSESFDWRLRLRLSNLEHTGDAQLGLDPSPAARRWTLQFAATAAVAAVVVLVAGLFVFRRPESGPTVVQVPQEVAPQLVIPAQPAPALQVQWPRPVPVRYGAPLGPEPRPMPSPSILGDVTSDSIGAGEWRRVPAPVPR